ncbi:hypothetical protein C2S52_006302 [Perilla frutescens var. hirtella]|nr:hypothetical protein C2S52_006302 [Perilla frutescens var. hirtella]
MFLGVEKLVSWSRLVLYLWIHAKHKEKRQKADKDRKKDKEKKEKDGSEKQRDKKDRKGKHKDKKEKHGDRKKDKEDRGKDKDKSSISEESTVAGKLVERSGEELHPEGHNKYSSVEDEGKCSTFFQGQNGKRPSQSILPSQATKEARFVQELDRRIRDDEKGRGSQFLQRVATMGKRDQEATVGTSIWNPLQVLSEEKSNDGDKSFQGKKLELQARNGEFIGKGTVQNLTRVAKSQNEGIPRPLEEHNDSRLEDKEKYKETGGNKQGDKQKDRDKKSHGKDKHKEKEKKKEEKKKEKKKEKEKKKKSILNIENEKSEPEKSKISGRNDLAGAACNKNVNLLKDVVGTALNAGSIGNVNIENEKSEPEKSKISGRNDLAGAACIRSVNLSKNVATALNEGSIKKRKDLDTNGFLHESEIRPNKVQRLALHHSTENGRKLEASIKSSSDKHAVPNNVRLDHCGLPSNGIIEAKKPSSSKPNPSGINMVSDQIVVPPKQPHPDLNNVNEEAVRMPKMKDHATEASRRPPHPDSKYLSQILTVPTVVDLPEDDDQEWLYSKKGPPNKPELESVGANEELHVWSEAVHIESADVYALPYVIPY